MYRFLFILLMSFTFTQEPCDGTCFSEQEIVNITNNIKELEFELEKNKEIEGITSGAVYLAGQID